MRHSLPIHVSPETYDKFNACVHCGLCLPACPTYVETANEADSPRGRIHLMRATVDGVIEPSAIVNEHLDRCLVCRACETACPSGVQYHELIEAVRPQLAQHVHGRTLQSPILEFVVKHIFPYPRRVALSVLPLRLANAVGLGGLAQKVARMMPGPLGAMTEVLPDGPILSRSLPAFTPALGERRGSVLLLQGCVGSVVSRDLNAACITVLTRNGFDVHTLSAEPCCGAMAAHANDPQGAADFAAQLVELLATRDDDYFVSPIAGCGAQLKALDHVLHDQTRYHDKVRAVVRKMRDINEFLGEVGLRPPQGRIERTVTYHDPCHLLNAQRISETPRQLLRQIPGLTLVALPETDLCCGAAGTYNLSQPEMAAQLGQRKVGNIQTTGATECITANVGCQLQIERHLKAAGQDMPVRHVIELLAESYAKSPV